MDRVFTWAKLRLGGNSIRLLKVLEGEENEEIACELNQYPIHRRPPYDALSYAWGNSSDEKQIKLNGQPFSIRTNLYAFLVQRRQDHKDVALWVDAICIDQNNIDERNFVVSLMDQIFERADTVYVWLGTEARYTADAFQVLREASQPQHVHRSEDGKAVTVEWLLAPEIKNRWPALLELCQTEYWGRVWIIQEVLLASHAVICCGKYSTSIGNVEAFVSQVDGLRARIALAESNFSSPPATLKWLSFGTFNFDTFHRILCETPAYKVVSFRRARRYEGLKRAKTLAWNITQHNTGRAILDVPTDLDQLLEKFEGAQCTDPRDGVLGLLGIADDFRDHKIDLVDYARKPVEIFLMFAPFYLQKQRSPFTALRRLARVLKIHYTDLRLFGSEAAQSEMLSSFNDGASLFWPPHTQSPWADLRRIHTMPTSPNKDRGFRATQARLAEWFLEKVATERTRPLAGSHLDPTHLCETGTGFGAGTTYTVISCMKTHTTSAGADAVFMGLMCSNAQVDDFILTVDPNLALVLRRDDASSFKTVGTAIVLTTQPTSFCQEFCDHACAAGLSCAMVDCAPEPSPEHTIKLDPWSILALVDAGVHESPTSTPLSDGLSSS